MKKAMLIWLAAWALLLAAAGPVLAKDTFKQDMQTLFDQSARDMAKGDLKAMLALALPEVRFYLLDGRALSAEQWRSEVADKLGRRATSAVRFKVEKAQHRRQRGVVTMSETQDYTLKDEPGHKYRLQGSWRAVLRQLPEGWRLQEFRQLSFSLSKDGKPFTPAPPAPGN